MKNSLISFTVLVVLLLAVAWADDKAGRISIVAIISSPERYSERRIEVAGYVRMGFEESSLCISREPPSTKECLWVEIDSGPYKDQADLDRFDAAQSKWMEWNGRIAVVAGVFSEKISGYSRYSGVIQDAIIVESASSSQ